MAIYFTSDLHLGHDRDFVWGARGFENLEAMETAIVERFNSTVTDDDVVNKITQSAHRVRDHSSGMSSGADYTLYRREDHDRFSRTAEIDHGFDVVSASKVINGHLTLKIHSSLEAGEGKIAIIQDNKVIEYLPFGANVTREYDVKGESLFLVKTVCDNAKISIKIERTIVTHD